MTTPQPQKTSSNRWQFWCIIVAVLTVGLIGGYRVYQQRQDAKEAARDATMQAWPAVLQDDTVITAEASIVSMLLGHTINCDTTNTKTGVVTVNDPNCTDSVYERRFIPTVDDVTTACTLKKDGVYVGVRPVDVDDFRFVLYRYYGSEVLAEVPSEAASECPDNTLYLEVWYVPESAGDFAAVRRKALAQVRAEEAANKYAFEQ